MSWWLFKNKSNNVLPFVRDFIKKGEVKIPDIREISQLDFTVLDTETTGLDPQKDYILSFGAIKLSKSTLYINSSVEWYPQSPSEGMASAVIHGLVNRENQITIKDFSQQLLAYLDASIIVGHHIAFDLEMLLKILKNFGLPHFPNPVLDTMNLAIRLDHGPLADYSLLNRNNYSLDKLCERYEIPIMDRHTAAGDAFLTAQLLQKLLNVAENKGITNFGQLIR